MKYSTRESYEFFPLLLDFMSSKLTFFMIADALSDLGRMSDIDRFCDRLPRLRKNSREESQSEEVP